MKEVFSIGWGGEEERSTATEAIIKKNMKTEFPVLSELEKETDRSLVNFFEFKKCHLFKNAQTSPFHWWTCILIQCFTDPCEMK